MAICSKCGHTKAIIYEDENVVFCPYCWADTPIPQTCRECGRKDATLKMDLIERGKETVSFFCNVICHFNWNMRQR
jgi:primosomal protein N'